MTTAFIALLSIGISIAGLFFVRRAGRGEGRAEAERDAMQGALDETRTVHDIERDISNLDDADLDRMLEGPRVNE